MARRAAVITHDDVRRVVKKPSDIAKEYKYVLREVTRHGKTIWYFRRGTGARIRLPEPGSPEFEEAYGLAMAGCIKPRPPSENQHRYRSNVEHKVKLLLKGAKRRAEAREFEYELDWDWVHSQLDKQKYKCALTGISFEWKDKFYGPSIDRIDSSVGYTKRNTRIVLVCVNVMLSDWGEHVLRRVSRAYVKHNKVPLDE
jgi:hypothetical protein